MADARDAVTPGPSSGPPAELVASLVEGPSVLAGLDWRPEVSSTNDVAAEAAAQGVEEIFAIGADAQRAGRGRLGRAWHAPPGSSLLTSLVLRPPPARQAAPALALLPLLTGLALAETVSAHLPEVAVAVKWPNDLLVDERKAAGILVEGPRDGAVIVGIGVNIDWRGLERPPELAEAVSLAEAKQGAVDRWRVFAGFIGIFGNRYREWGEDATAFLPAYRRHCATIGRLVEVQCAGRPDLRGHAEDVGDDGALLLRDQAGERHRVSVGDVIHVRAPST